MFATPGQSYPGLYAWMPQAAVVAPIVTPFSVNARGAVTVIAPASTGGRLD